MHKDMKTTNRYHNKEKEKMAEAILTEMCDVCGRSYPAPIPRYCFFSKTNIKYVIRFCPSCNPQIFGELYLP